MTLRMHAGERARLLTAVLACGTGLCGLYPTPTARAAGVPPSDPRLRDVTYDPSAVVTVPVKRGVVTLVVLDANEVITEVAAGLGSDCAKLDAAWCVASQPLGHTLFVKPKSSADAANNLVVVTDQRSHVFRFVVLPDGNPTPPVYRLTVTAPKPPVLASSMATLPALPSPERVVAERLKAKPQVANANYAIAEGKASDDIAPTLIFDDGRFTYLKFPGNRELPTVFQVLGDGSETLVNARIEDDLLVVDRVSRKLVLRSGSAVVGVWNEAFDLDGAPPPESTSVPGVRRALKGPASVAAANPPDLTVPTRQSTPSGSDTPPDAGTGPSPSTEPTAPPLPAPATADEEKRRHE
jgi:type IV secretion system protein VirB9